MNNFCALPFFSWPVWKENKGNTKEKGMVMEKVSLPFATLE